MRNPRRKSAAAGLGRPWLFALAFGYTAASLDLIALIAYDRPPAVRYLWGALFHFSETFFFAIAVYLGFSVPVVVWAAVFHRPREGLLVGLFAALLLPSAFFALQRADSRHQILENVYLAALLLGVGLVLGILAGRSPAPPEGQDRLDYLATLLPVEAWLACGFIWLRHYQLPDGASLRSFLLVVVFLALLGACGWSLRAAFFRKVAFAILCSGLLLLALAASSPVSWRFPREDRASSEGRHKVRHAILITADTLRRDAVLGPEPRAVTPHLDRLASESIVFLNAYAPSPWTLPSVATTLTGVSPWVHGLGFGGAPAHVVPTVADAFRAAGYATGAVGVNPLILAQRRLARGFQSFFFFPSWGPETLASLFTRETGWRAPEDLVTTTDVSSAAMAWIADHRDDDFFLWVHYFDPHDPYTERPGFPAGDPVPRIGSNVKVGDLKERPAYSYSKKELDWIKGLYLAEVQYLDQQVGRLLDHLRGQGIYDEALLVFTSDHGEQFLEHGGFGHDPLLYDELLAVPLFVKLPVSRSSGSTVGPVRQLASLEDIAPTLLDVCGVDGGVDLMDGASLEGHWNPAEPKPVEHPVFSTPVTPKGRSESVIAGSWKLIQYQSPTVAELFDLANDPGETQSLLESHLEVAARLRTLLAEHGQRSKVRQQALRKATAGGAEEHEEVLRQMKALGYLQ